MSQDESNLASSKSSESDRLVTPTETVTPSEDVTQDHDDSHGEIPESVPHDDLKTLDKSDDREMPTKEKTPMNHNKALAGGIAAILILIFIGGWLYKDEIFAFFRVMFKKDKKKPKDEESQE